MCAWSNIVCRGNTATSVQSICKYSTPSCISLSTAANGITCPSASVTSTDLHAYKPMGETGLLDQAFEPLQQAPIVQIELQVVSLDSISVKMHPDGTDAPQKTVGPRSEHFLVGGTSRKKSLARNGGTRAHHMLSITRISTRCAARS